VKVEFARDEHRSSADDGSSVEAAHAELVSQHHRVARFRLAQARMMLPEGADVRGGGRAIRLVGTSRSARGANVRPSLGDTCPMRDAPCRAL
jgi:hypothetical protein